MTTLALAYSSVKSISLPRINWKIFCAVGSVLIFFLAVYYIYSINNLMNGTYLIRNYQTKLDKILEENRNLQVAFAETSFMESIKSKTDALNFEKVKEVKYIQILETSVAKK